MSWSWVSELKNKTSGSIKLAVPGFVPTDADLGTVSFTKGGYRESNSESGTSANYLEGRALIADIASQIAAGVDNVHDYTSNYDKWFYGLTGGSAINFFCQITASGANYSANFSPWRWLNYGSRVVLGSLSASFMPDTALRRAVFAWAIAIDDEREIACLCLINTSLIFVAGEGQPRYYDRASVILYPQTNGAFPAGNYNIYNVIKGSIPGGGGDNPYGDDDYDEPIGGDGTHDENSDVIDPSPIPVAAATRSGMVTAFVPTWGEIQSVANALLDPNFFQILASNVVKASDVIIALSIFPCSIPADNTGTVTANFLGLNLSTGIVCHYANDQFVEFSCGQLTVEEYWGNCLDYNPYTSISIFLPFCGMYELDTDEVMGKTLDVSYRIDIFSGSCLATIKIDGSIFYQYSGQCSSQVPLSSVSFDQFLGSMIDLGVATATGVSAIRGAAGELAAADKNFHLTKQTGSARQDYLDAKETYQRVREESGTKTLGASVNAVMGGKGFYNHAGAMSGSPGFLGVKTPYLIIKRPEQVIPSMYGKFHGYPANTTAVLGDLAGYTEIGDIRLNIPDATVDEIIECEQLLKGGVVI